MTNLLWFIGGFVLGMLALYGAQIMVASAVDKALDRSLGGDSTEDSTGVYK